MRRHGMAELLGKIAVDAADVDADFASAALERAARDDVDDAADRVAVAIGCRCLDYLDRRDAVARELRQPDAASAARGRNAIPSIWKLL